MEINKVIDGNYCIGCGACGLGRATVEPLISMNALGFYEARLDEEVDTRVDHVCPFTNTGPDESEIAKSLLEDRYQSHHEYIGSYISLYAGHASTGGFRERGSSGGITTWLLAKLLNKGKVDAIVHVRASEKPGLLYEYGVSSDLDTLYSGAKSHYYPVEMSGVLRHIHEKQGRYAVVGVPCFIKALRRLMLVEPVFSERIVYCGGLFCGHLKGKGFAEMLATQCEVGPTELFSFDFRTKLSGRSSSDYGVTATGVLNGEKFKKISPVSQLVGTDWGMGFFKYKACDYCDDISAETADFSVGDAWLPKYKNDHRGTNILIVRNEDVQSIVDEGIISGDLTLEIISADEVIESQRANVRHRREDLPYRLRIADEAGLWRPKKRQCAGRSISKKRQLIQDCRISFQEQIPVLWNNALVQGNPKSFFNAIQPLIKRYKKIYTPFFLIRLHRRIKRMSYTCLKNIVKCLFG